MVQFYLRFKTTTSRLSRRALIQAFTNYEPTYSPGALVTNKDISCRVLQNQLRANDALISTVSALMVTWYRPAPREPPPIRIYIYGSSF
jgi:hypothetical protein